MAIEITTENFSQEVLQSDKLVVVDFWAPWCGPCKMLTPIIEELATEYEGKAKICKLNTDENNAIAAQFQITSIPCIIFFKGGAPIQKIVGFKPKNDLKRAIDEAL